MILKPEYTIDNFETDDNNRFAVKAAEAIISKSGSVYNPILFYGKVGTGKTHLIKAIENGITEKYPEKSVISLNGAEFIDKFIESVRLGSIKEFKKRFRAADVLLIDDIQEFINKTATQEELLHTFNALYDINKQIVLTCNIPIKELDIDNSLKTIINKGLQLTLHCPTPETQFAFLINKLAEKHISLSDEILDHLHKVKTYNMRELCALQVRLIAYSDLTERQITIKYVKKTFPLQEKIPLQENYQKLKECIINWCRNRVKK